MKHASLVRSSCVLQTKRHRDIAECAKGGDESGGMLVGFLHGYLVVTGVCVHEGKELVSSGRVHNLVNTRERKGVHGTCLIQPSAVDAHPAGPVLLLDKHGISDPHWVVYLHYEPRHQDSCYLFAYGLAFFHQSGEAVG